MPQPPLEPYHTILGKRQGTLESDIPIKRRILEVLNQQPNNERKEAMRRLIAKVRQQRKESEDKKQQSSRKKGLDRSRAAAASRAEKVVADVVDMISREEKTASVVDDVYTKVKRDVRNEEDRRLRMKNMLKKMRNTRQQTTEKTAKALDHKRKARQKAIADTRISGVLNDVVDISRKMQQAKQRADAVVESVVHQVKYKKHSPAMTAIIQKAQRERAQVKKKKTTITADKKRRVAKSKQLMDRIRSQQNG